MISENITIRKLYDNETQKWYFSIVDAIEQAVSTTDARNYWKVLKNRLKKGDNQLVTKCNQLKMIASDGKWYLTDTADGPTLVEIVRLIAPSAVSALRLWIAKTEGKSAPFEAKNDSPCVSSFPQAEGFTDEQLLSIDLLETPSSFVVTAFIAGITPATLVVTATATTLLIKGNRIAPSDASLHYHHQELFWGAFSRTLALPAEVTIDTIEAVESRGRLTVTLQKINRKRMRTVKIQSR